MASGWLQKAQAVFGRREEPPQLYVVTCECGMRYSGVRAAKPQKTVCSRCGAGLFIFPVCPYPLPESVARRMRGEVVVPPTEPETARTGSDRRRGDKKSRKQTAEPAAKPTSRSPAEPPIPREPSVPLGQRLRAILTPLRIVMIALAATIGGTIAIAVRQSQLEHARRDVEPSIERGLKAYAAHDFATAATELAGAVRSLDRLQRRDPVSQQVRQRAAEAHAAAGLLSSSFSETLLELLNESSRESLSTRVERRLAGQWLFLDTALIASIDSDSRFASPQLEVEGSMQIGKLNCRMEFARHLGTGWPEAKPNPVPQRAIFAAQIETVRVGESTAESDAVIVLRPATALLWTSGEGYAGLVPPPTDAAERERWQGVLDAQRAALSLPQEGE